MRVGLSPLESRFDRGVFMITIKAPDGFRYTDGIAYGKTIILPSAEDVVKWQLVTEEEYKKAMEARHYIAEVL